MGLDEGLELMRAGAYFAAHEELELAWRAAPDGERDFFQGLVHVAVAWYQAGRGNRVGCERQLEKAAAAARPVCARAPRRRRRPRPRLGCEAAGRARRRPGRSSCQSVLGCLSLKPRNRQRAVQVDAQPPEAVEEEQHAERDEDRAADDLDRT